MYNVIQRLLYIPYRHDTCMFINISANTKKRDCPTIACQTVSRLYAELTLKFSFLHHSISLLCGHCASSLITARLRPRTSALTEYPFRTYWISIILVGCFCTTGSSLGNSICSTPCSTLAAMASLFTLSGKSNDCSKWL